MYVFLICTFFRTVSNQEISQPLQFRKEFRPMVVCYRPYSISEFYILPMWINFFGLHIKDSNCLNYFEPNEYYIEAKLCDFKDLNNHAIIDNLLLFNRNTEKL